MGGMYHDVSDLMKNNTRTRWGNKFGMLLLPFPYHRDGSDPLQYLKRAKVMIDRKKQSFEAYFTYKIGYFVMSFLGSKVTCQISTVFFEFLMLLVCVH